MLKRTIAALILVTSTLAISWAEGLSIKGPNGNLALTLAIKNGVPSYTVTYKGTLFLENSPLGLVTNVGDFSRGLTLSEVVTRSRIDETYELRTIKHSRVHYVANEAVFAFLSDTLPAFDLIVKVSNNDIAFRYRVHPQGERRVCVVEQEKTGFVLPVGTTTFLSPQMHAMTGWSRTAPSYETPYTSNGPMGQNGWGEGYIFPALFRVNSEGWVLISETGVDSRYCASRLIGHPNGLYTIGFPQPGENNGIGSVSPGIALPGYTPWRTITVGQTLAPIVETTIPWDVVEPLYEPSREYKFTRGAWSWIIKMDRGTTFEEQVRYIDFSAAMGWETVLVDALWDTQIGRDRIVELAEYARSKGIYLYLWYNTNGYWNDAPQGPRGFMDRLALRRTEMAWMQSIGIKGIKVDFFGGDKQVTMQLYEDILYDANDHGLLVIFHGCTLPRGWERMFPNFATSEAVLASEMLHFTQERNETEAYQATMHPFIRNTVGSMDFGGTVLNEYWNAHNTPGVGTRRRTSDIFQLATAVLFQSPVQHFAMAPNNLTDAPAWAIDFMRNVSVTWDETRYIAGYPGKYVILARRNGNKWYIAGINAQNETLRRRIKLPMIPAGSQLQLYSDDAKLNGNLRTIKLPRNQEIELIIPTNGGALLVY